MRILIADAQTRVRFALRVLLDRQPNIKVVGEAVNAESLLVQARNTCPDALLLGWELPGMSIERLMCELRKSCPDMDVIALSGRLEAHRAALSIGVEAFVSKSSPPEELLAALATCECRHPHRPEQHEGLTPGPELVNEEEQIP
jgi:DNA-binding NarL/FixJ family response regulator